MYRIVLTALLFTIAVEAENCPTDKSQLAPVRLKKDLLCSYEKTLRPVKDHKTAVSVALQMILKYFIYDPHDNSFTVDSWMAMVWKDEHLTWDPGNYDSIKSIQLSDIDIWMPDISVYNRREQSGNPSAVSAASCIVYNTGQVMCVPPARHTSLCVADMTNFPFDTQNCTVRFGSWIHNGEEVNVELAKIPITTEDIMPNGEWRLVETKVVKHPGKFKNNTYPSVNFSFKIKRIPEAHSASLLIPALTLVIITLSSLWLSPTNPQRLFLCYVNLICNFYYVETVSWWVPMNGEKTARILLFARDELLLAAFATIISIALKHMIQSVRPTPGWISGAVSILIALRPGQFVLLNDSSAKGVAKARGEDDGTTIIQNDTTDPQSKDWLIFAKILDMLCLLAYCFVYLCMIIGFAL